MRLASAIAPVVFSALVIPSSGMTEPAVPDSLYSAHHPRLLFSASDRLRLADAIKDGGPDDDAYDATRDYVYNGCLPVSPASLMGAYYGLEAVPSLGLVAHLATPADPAVMAKGKLVTLFIADTYEPDYDEAGSGMRLRSLALGYDLFFGTASEAERANVRDEIVRYIDRMIASPQYQAFEYRPYLGNHSAMFGAALGLAAIGLDGEADAVLLAQAMAMADRIVANLLQYQFDPGGAYNEGGLYATWTLRQLVYYFDARLRFDGYDYSANATVRAVEQWLPYELLPEGGGRSFNLNDSPYITTPFARNPTYFDWAMSRWNGGLSAWMWEHTAGRYGLELGMATDKTATVLWHRDTPPLQPDTVLPLHRVWLQRGLYHVRTGWQTGASSVDDVAFSFYSGKFQGGHAQEDQNQFSLVAYGVPFVVDHGSGGVGKQSEAHNLVFVDGAGQHNAGGSIGTDGRIAQYLLGGAADYVVGDATAAYGTYSEFNAPDVPFPGTDWSWGYAGANPVRFAFRRILAVHGDDLPPYFVVMDDVDKDGLPHAYEWRLHTRAGNQVETTGQPWRVSGAGAVMDVYALQPPLDSLSVTVSPFDNLNSDPNSTLLRVACTDVEAHFSFLLLPRKSAMPAPTVSQAAYAWGATCSVDWGDGRIDWVLCNDSPGIASNGVIATDARVAWVRVVDGDVRAYLAAEATALTFDGVDYVAINDGPATCEMSGSTIRLDRAPTDFRFYDVGIATLYQRDQPIGFVVDGGFLVPPAATAIDDAPRPPGWEISAHPNPFNPSTTVRIEGLTGERLSLVVYDVAGRVVRTLWRGRTRQGESSWQWDGRDDGNRPVASGTYFLRASTASGSRALKVTLLK